MCNNTTFNYFKLRGMTVGDLSREQLHGERFNYRSIDKKRPLMGLEGILTHIFFCVVHTHTSSVFINA